MSCQYRAIVTLERRIWCSDVWRLCCLVPRQTPIRHKLDLPMNRITTCLITLFSEFCPESRAISRRCVRADVVVIALLHADDHQSSRTVQFHWKWHSPERDGVGRCVATGHDFIVFIAPFDYTSRSLKCLTRVVGYRPAPYNCSLRFTAPNPTRQNCRLLFSMAVSTESATIGDSLRKSQKPNNKK